MKLNHLQRTELAEKILDTLPESIDKAETTTGDVIFDV